MPTLIVSEENEVTTVSLGDEPVTVGRASDNSIQIRDIKSSRHHLRISKREGGYVVEDLDSQNGTRVNGARIKEHVLTHGDCVQVGSVQILFEYPAQVTGQKVARASLPVEADMGKDAHATRVSEPRVRRRAWGRHRGRIRRRAPVGLVKGKPPSLDGTLDALREAIGEVVAVAGKDGFEASVEVLREVGKLLGESVDMGNVPGRRELARLLDLNKLINSERNLKRLLEVIMDSVVELTRAERGFIVLSEGDRMNVETARNFDRETIRRPDFKISHSIAEEVLHTGKPLLTADAQEDEKLKAYMSVSDLRLRSVLCVPLRTKQAVIGVAYLDNRFKEGVFGKDDLWLLERLADQAAIAIENARLLEENYGRQKELQESKEEVERLNSLLADKVERQSAELDRVRRALEEQQADVQLKYSYENMVGQSEVMKRAFVLMDKVTDSSVPVVIEGESGTGKELVARAIHFNGPRRQMRFVSENCAALSETLLETELFGHVKGAFTGAHADKVGLIRFADGGTLMLDEIGDMSLEMQKKLLRVLELGEVRPVGGKEALKVDVRVISATNRDLSALVREGRFREDLFYRLNVVRIRIPPLRERREDIPLLVDHFLMQISSGIGKEAPKVDREAMNLLSAYDWPGNVRELQNELKRIVALGADAVTAELLKEEIWGQGARRSLAAAGVEAGAGGVELGAGISFEGKELKDLVREAVEAVEKKAIEVALEKAGGVKTEAARLLGISRPTLDAKIALYDLSVS